MPDTLVAQEATPYEQALPVGEFLSGNQFKISGHLGAGGFGITYRAQDNVLGRTIVIKECFPEDFCLREGTRVAPRSTSYTKPVRSVVKMFMREAQSLARLRHPNVVGVHGAFEQNDTAYMVLDLIDGQDLLDMLLSKQEPLPPRRIRSILIQLLDAIESVHAAGLLHRDISPDNIIIEKSGTPILIDFGAARAEASTRTRAISSMLVVKDGYSPQEFYVAGAEQGPCSDLYALAATFYHVLTGEAPAHSQARMIEIAGKKPDPCVPLAGRIEGYDTAFLEAIDTAMQVHPNDRLQSAAQWKALITDASDAALGADHAIPDLPNNVVDLELERSLSKLVQETNVEVRKSRLSVPKPVPEDPAPRVSSRPDWVEEFNLETKALDAKSQDGARAKPGIQVKSTVDRDALENNDIAPPDFGATGQAVETDWIERAKDKHHRTWVAVLSTDDDEDEGAGPVTQPDADHPKPDVLADIDDVVLPPPKGKPAIAEIVAGVTICCAVLVAITTFL